MKITVGSRESALAVAQARIVINAIKKHSPNIDIELLTMKTIGDKILDKTPDAIGEKGLFVKELDKALTDGRVDITVHSLKDMPTDINPQLPIIAVSEREDPRDALILRKGLDKMDLSQPIGSASKRRSIQLKNLFPDAVIKPIRGNIQTRLEKLDRGDFGALVLAYAGIKRLGLEDRVSRVFEVDEILPASCQGVLAVQGRRDFDISVLQGFHSEKTSITAAAERAFIHELDGGCSSPSAGYAVIENGRLILNGFYADENGKSFKQSITGDINKAEELGRCLARSMKGRCCENG